MRRHEITSFYIETLLLIGVFIAIILLIAQVFGFGRKQSTEAEMLTHAVTLAQNAAEAVASSRSPEDVLALLDVNGNARQEKNEVNASYRKDMTPDAGGELLVSVSWEQSETPDLVKSRITVFYEKSEQPVYMLETAVCIGE